MLNERNSSKYQPSSYFSYLLLTFLFVNLQQYWSVYEIICECDCHVHQFVAYTHIIVLVGLFSCASALSFHWPFVQQIYPQFFFIFGCRYGGNLEY